MADLGAIGMRVAKPALLPLDTAMAQNITVNPIVCRGPRYRAQPYNQDWKSVSGVVTDDVGANASRRVYLFRRGTGEFVGTALSDATTGAYSIASPYPADEHIRIVLDDDAGTFYNDLIDRVLPV